MKRKLFTTMIPGILCLSLAACSSAGKADEPAADAAGGNVTNDAAADGNAGGYDPMEWENDPTIGKVQPGCYKRVAITKDNESYEEMLRLRSIGKKGYLIVRDDGSATFELDDEKTEYVYDKFNFYLSDDTERSKGIPYTFIGGRLIVDDGETITQYLKLSDEEAGSVSGNGGNTEDPAE